jgi:hypothetical protein
MLKQLDQVTITKEETGGGGAEVNKVRKTRRAGEFPFIRS